MSTGFLTDASAGRNARRRSSVCETSGVTVRPRLSQASEAMIPGPPALVRMATRRPRGTGWLARSIATSNSSSIVSVRMTPAWPSSASTPTSMPAREPVCELAARAPASVRPLFTTTMGLVRETRRAISMKRFVFPRFSR